MATEPTTAATMRLLGGALALDFANTANWHETDQPEERLRSYDDLLGWAVHAGAITAGEAEQLRREAVRYPEGAVDVLGEAIALREAIFRIFSGLAAGSRPNPADIDLLNEMVARSLAHARVVPTEDGFSWSWEAGAPALDRMLWPVVRSVADLLTSELRSRVRLCAGHPCGWLFLDMSRNRSRRWCNMDDCGNRAKARRHYQRRRAAVPDVS